MEAKRKKTDEQLSFHVAAKDGRYGSAALYEGSAVRGGGREGRAARDAGVSVHAMGRAALTAGHRQRRPYHGGARPLNVAAAFRRAPAAPS